MHNQTHRDRLTLYTRLLLRIILWSVGIITARVWIPRLLPLLLPFILAVLIAGLLNPLVSVLHEKFRLPRPAVTLLLVSVSVLALASLIGWIIYQLAGQVLSVASELQSIWDYIIVSFSTIDEKLTWFLNIIPSEIKVTFNTMFDTIWQSLQAGSGKIINNLTSKAVTATAKLANLGMGFIICIMAAYFITAEYKQIHAYITDKFSGKLHHNFELLKTALKTALGGFIKSQLLLALLTFTVMFAALVCYRQQYALLIALLIAVVDFLPFIGAAIVLVPWAIVVLFHGEIGKSLFLLLLAFAFSLIRKFAEPRIVGSQTGLHPLSALISSYLGLKITGLWGAAFGPVVVMVAINIYQTGIFGNTISDIKDVFRDIGNLLARR